MKNQIKELYYNQGVSILKIAQRLNVSYQDVQNCMRENNMPMKSELINKGSKLKSKRDGYIYSRKGIIPILEHRLVMERYLERKLTDEEVVHHIDGNKSNNKISNLYLCRDNRDHRKIHALQSKIKRDVMKSIKGL